MLDDYGWSDSVAERFAALETSDGYPSRVARIDRGSCLVATANGMVAATAATDLADGGIAVGDWALVRGDDRSGRLVTALAERTSAIVRRDPAPGDNRDQTLAANLDTAFILYRLDRKLRMAVLERYMVLVWDSDVSPVIVLSKADLVDPATENRAVAEVERAAPNVPVVALSGLTGRGLAELDPHLQAGMSVALIGESGVGKSTLVNRLIGTELLDTGPTRASDGKGRHTTTAREMIPLGNGAVLIDTPGLRSVGLGDAGEGMANVFADLEDLMTYCRFRDCAHESEPGCAVRTAIEHGVMDQRRLDSYRKLQAEQARLARRKQQIARRAERKQSATRRSKSIDRSREP